MMTCLSWGLTSSTKVAVEKALLSKEYWHKKLSICFLHWNLDGPQMPELLVIGTHLDFRIHVSPKQLTSLLSRSQSKAFYLICNIPSEIIDFISCSGILIDQICEKKTLLFWICLDIQTHISLFYLFCFSIEELIDSFFETWGRLLSSKYHEKCPLHRNWNADWP